MVAAMREYGPVRFVLGYTPEQAEDAQRYVQTGRTFLGIAKNLMTLGGSTFAHRKTTLSDGTVILCTSNMGSDTVIIVPPVRQPNKRARRTVKQVVTLPPEYGWFRLPDGPPKNGHQAVWDVANKRMLVWGGYDRPGMDIPATPEYLDDDMDIIWEARSGGTIRYATIPNNTFSTLVDGVMTEFWHATSWYTYETGVSGPINTATSIGYGPLTASGLVAQLYIGDTWQDKADAVRYDMPGMPSIGAGVDMLSSTALWQFQFTAGMPWAANGATAGAWTQLANISYNDWQAIVADAGSVDVSIDNAWAPDQGDALNQVTYAGGEFALGAGYYPGYTSDDYFELYFGGTKDGTDTNASAQLWMYGPIVTAIETEIEIEEPAP
jgi:hypothetical protein